MNELKRTDTIGFGKFSHYHFVFLRDDADVVLTSVDADHQHEVVWQPPQPPVPPGQIDPNTGQPIPPTPGSPGGWVVLPGGSDMHVHQLQQIDVRLPKKKRDDKETIKEIYALFKASSEHWDKSVRAADESEGFYTGEKQWHEEDRNALKSLDRACVTINLIGKNIDELCGVQREQRTDIKYTPMEGGDQRVADLLNIVVKYILQRCYYEREESRVFKDQCIAGVGYFNIYVDFDDQLQGEIKVEWLDRKGVLLGPTEKEGLEDCEYLLKHKMYSKAKLRQIYGDKVDEIESKFQEFLITQPENHITYASDQYGKSDNSYSVTVGDYSLVDVAKKEFRLIECQRKVYNKIPVIACPDAEFYQRADGWKKKDLETIATLDGFAVVDRVLPQIRITRICGNTVLSDENPADLVAVDYFVVPAWANKHGSHFWGKVEAAKDPQREINKRHSQAIDVGNKMVAYNWFYDDGTFIDEKEYQRFKNQSSMPGAIFKLNSASRPPTKNEGVKFPGELVELMKLGVEQVNGMMNIVVQPQGANDSGAKLIAMQKMKMTGNEFLFDNLLFAKKKLGRLLVPLIQKYYSPDRIYRIVSHVNQKDPITLAGQEFDTFSEEEIKELLKDKDLSLYDVETTEIAHSPTMRLGNFLLMSDLARNGVPIPPQALIKLMDMPESVRKETLGMMAAQMQQGQQAEANKDQTEVEKTLIAQGIVPQKTQQELGVPAGLTPDAAQNASGAPAPQGPQQPQASAQPSQPASGGEMATMLSIIDKVASMRAPKTRKVGRIVHSEDGSADFEVKEIPDIEVPTPEVPM
jgi:hypothetical protein